MQIGKQSNLKNIGAYCAAVKSRHNILDVIRLSVPLKKRGNIYFGLCPFHKESTPSFSVYPEHQWFKCYGCSSGGDVIDFVAKTHGVNKLEAAKILSGDNSASRNDSKGKVTRVIKKQEEIAPIDWESMNQALTERLITKLSIWRGYSIEFCQWMKEKKIIGVYSGGFCFPITIGKKIVRAHVRMPRGRGWYYFPKQISVPITPLIVWGGLRMHFFESQWDMFAAMDATRQHHRITETWIATRGASNASRLKEFVSGNHNRHIYPQNDQAGEGWKMELVKAMGVCLVHRVPGKFGDVNEFLRQGGRIGEVNKLFRNSLQ